MSFLLKLFKKKDPFETELRGAAAKLLAYEGVLTKEWRKWQGVPAQRAAEVERTRDEARRKLMLLYSWALMDLLDTFYAQAHLQMRRAWLKTVVDAAVIQALEDHLKMVQAWRRELNTWADERAAHMRAIEEGHTDAATLSRYSGIEEMATRFVREGVFPLDVDGVIKPPPEVYRENSTVRKLQRRIGKINERLVELDAEIQALKPLLRPPRHSDRQSRLQSLLHAEHADQAAMAGVDDAVAGALQRVVAALSTVPSPTDIMPPDRRDKLLGTPSMRPLPPGAPPATTLAAAAAVHRDAGAAGPLSDGLHLPASARGAAGGDDGGGGITVAGRSSPRHRHRQVTVALHPCAQWMPMLLHIHGADMLAAAAPAAGGYRNAYNPFQDTGGGSISGGRAGPPTPALSPASGSSGPGGVGDAISSPPSSATAQSVAAPARSMADSGEGEAREARTSWISARFVVGASRDGHATAASGGSGGTAATPGSFSPSLALSSFTSRLGIRRPSNAPPMSASDAFAAGSTGGGGGSGGILPTGSAATSSVGLHLAPSVATPHPPTPTGPDLYSVVDAWTSATAAIPVPAPAPPPPSRPAPPSPFTGPTPPPDPAPATQSLQGVGVTRTSSFGMPESPARGANSTPTMGTLALPSSSIMSLMFKQPEPATVLLVWFMYGIVMKPEAATGALIQLLRNQYRAAAASVPWSWLETGHSSSGGGSMSGPRRSHATPRLRGMAAGVTSAGSSFSGSLGALDGDLGSFRLPSSMAGRSGPGVAGASLTQPSAGASSRLVGSSPLTSVSGGVLATPTVATTCLTNSPGHGSHRDSASECSEVEGAPGKDGDGRKCALNRAVVVGDASLAPAAAPGEHQSLAQALRNGSGGGGGSAVGGLPATPPFRPSGHGTPRPGPTGNPPMSSAGQALAVHVGRRLASHLAAKCNESVLPALQAVHEVLDRKQASLRDRSARQRVFTQLIADTRTREGRVVQRWCHKYLAGGFRGEYAYDLTRYLGFDPGPAFAERTRQQLRIGVPILADYASAAVPLPPPTPSPYTPLSTTPMVGGATGGLGDTSGGRETRSSTQSFSDAGTATHSTASTVQVDAATRVSATGTDSASTGGRGGGSGDGGSRAAATLFSPPGVRSVYDSVKSPPQGLLTVPGGVSNGPVDAAAVLAGLHSPDRPIPTTTKHIAPTVTTTTTITSTLVASARSSFASDGGGGPTPAGAAPLLASTGGPGVPAIDAPPAPGVMSMLFTPSNPPGAAGGGGGDGGDMGVHQPPALLETSAAVYRRTSIVTTTVTTGPGGSSGEGGVGGGGVGGAGGARVFRYGGGSAVNPHQHVKVSPAAALPAGFPQHYLVVPPSALSHHHVLITPPPPNVSSVPTPNVISIFLRHFAREVLTEYDLLHMFKPADLPTPVIPPGMDAVTAGVFNEPHVAEAVRVMRSYVDRLLYPRLHTMLFVGLDIVNTDGSVPYFGPAGDDSVFAAASLGMTPAPGGGGGVGNVAALPAAYTAIALPAAITAAPAPGTSTPTDLISPLTPPVPPANVAALATSSHLPSLTGTTAVIPTGSVGGASGGGGGVIVVPGDATTGTVVTVIPIVGEGANVGASGDGSSEGTVVLMPARIPKSAADTLYKRDRVWQRRQPRAAMLTAAELGMSPAFYEALPTDTLLIPVPRGMGPPPAAAGGVVDPATSSQGSPHLRPASAMMGSELCWTFTYEPYSIASQLLECMDHLTDPAEMLSYMNAAIEAMIAEAGARSAAYQRRTNREKRLFRRRVRDKLTRLAADESVGVGMEGDGGRWAAGEGGLSRSVVANSFSLPGGGGGSGTPRADGKGGADPFGVHDGGVDGEEEDGEEEGEDPVTPPELAADDLIPLLNYTASRSTWKRPHACLSFVANYGIPQNSGGGREGYLITVLQTCVQYICQLKAAEIANLKAAAEEEAAEAAAKRAAKQADLEADEYRRHGRAPPPSTHTASGTMGTGRSRAGITHDAGKALVGSERPAQLMGAGAAGGGVVPLGADPLSAMASPPLATLPPGTRRSLSLPRGGTGADQGGSAVAKGLRHGPGTPTPTNPLAGEPDASLIAMYQSTGDPLRAISPMVGLTAREMAEAVAMATVVDTMAGAARTRSISTTSGTGGSGTGSGGGIARVSSASNLAASTGLLMGAHTPSSRAAAMRVRGYSGGGRGGRALSPSAPDGHARLVASPPHIVGARRSSSGGAGGEGVASPTTSVDDTGSDGTQTPSRQASPGALLAGSPLGGSAGGTSRRASGNLPHALPATPGGSIPLPEATTAARSLVRSLSTPNRYNHSPVVAEVGGATPAMNGGAVLASTPMAAPRPISGRLGPLPAHAGPNDDDDDDDDDAREGGEGVASAVRARATELAAGLLHAEPNRRSVALRALPLGLASVGGGGASAGGGDHGRVMSVDAGLAALQLTLGDAGPLTGGGGGADVGSGGGGLGVVAEAPGMEGREGEEEGEEEEEEGDAHAYDELVADTDDALGMGDDSGKGQAQVHSLRLLLEDSEVLESALRVFM